MMVKVIRTKTQQSTVVRVRDEDVDELAKFLSDDYSVVPLAYEMTGGARRLYGELPPARFERQIESLKAALEPGVEYSDMALATTWRCGSKEASLFRYWLGKLKHVDYDKTGKLVSLRRLDTAEVKVKVKPPTPKPKDLAMPLRMISRGLGQRCAPPPPRGASFGRPGRGES